MIHSRLGNGKSIFLSILAQKLSVAGYKCFWCRENSPLLAYEVNSLENLDNVVIFFDSYDIAIDVLNGLSEALPNAKFVIAVRTSIQEVRYHEIQKKLPSPFYRINLNKLYQSDRDDFTKLLDEAGILPKDLRKELEKCDDVREVVTTIYKNSVIQQKLEVEFKPLLEDKAVRTILIASHLLQWTGQKCGTSFLRIITGKDAYAEVARFKEIASEVLLFVDDELYMHSAIFSEYLIDNIFKSEDVIETIYQIIVEAVKRKYERSYQSIISKLMKVSALKQVVKSSVNNDILLAGLFDRLHRDIGVNKEPLFWLQYSILMLDCRDLSAAERFLDTSYARASENPGFSTYQIDTHSLRLLLLLEQNECEENTVIRFDSIIEKLDLIISMVGAESHRSYAMRVLDELEGFVSIRLTALSISERRALSIQLERLIVILTRSNDNHQPGGSVGLLKSIEKANAQLTC